MAKRASKKLPAQGDALKKEGQRWIERIADAWKREDTWAKTAEEAVTAYTNEATGNGKRYDYNILHSNTETIVPAIINSPPVPDIRRRFGDDDPVAKQLSDIIERAISVQVDDSRLAIELEGQAQDGFLAGRGVIRLRFHADTQETETSALEDAQDAAEDDAEHGGPDDTDDMGGPDTEGASDPESASDDDEPPGEEMPGVPQTVTGERITFEAVSWRDYQHGPAKRWEDRPWESFRHVMQQEDCAGFADKSLVAAQTEPGGKAFGEEDSDLVVYEVWNKPKKEVIFVSSDGKVLKKLPDPLGLSNFFPSGRPVQPLELVGRLMPVTPFSVYSKLADELDIVTKRIRVITAAMKVKGAFIGALGTDLMRLAEADDNELIAISGVEMAAQLQGGLNGALTWWPVEKFQPVLAELFKNRDLTKQAIYEITGISDIVRGASSPSETLGAQQIKSQWGALRIQKMQRMMERSARDLFVMMSEIIPAKFSHKTLEQMTAVPITILPTDSPEIVAQKQQLQALMKQKITTSYRVDVESDSTVRADLTQKKQEMAEFLAGSASFFQGMEPIVTQGGPAAAEGALTIYAAATRNFDLGKSAEDAIDKMVNEAKDLAQQAKDNPQPPKPTPDEIKAQIEGAKAQAAGAKAQADGQKAQAEAVLAAKDLELKQQIAAADARVRELEIASNERIENAKLDAADAKSRLDNFTKIVVQRIATEGDANAQSVEAQLAHDLGLTEQIHEVRMAALNHMAAKDLQASAPKPSPKGAS